jgi:CRP/FNR family transcriptional regulator
LFARVFTSTLKAATYRFHLDANTKWKCNDTMKKRTQLALPLEEHPFFRTLSPEFVQRISRFVHHRAYEPRQIIYFPEDVCDFAYWVREGQVKVTRHIKSSSLARAPRELTFRHLFPGDIFGEECMMERSHYGLYAEAVLPTILTLMRAADFRRIMREENELALVLLRRLIARANEVEQVLFETTSRSVRGRIAAGLARLHAKAACGEIVTLRVTHQEIASLVGSTRETTTAVLNSLEGEGFIKTANRRVTVLDPEALERVARAG